MVCLVVEFSDPSFEMIGNTIFCPFRFKSTVLAFTPCGLTGRFSLLRFIALLSVYRVISSFVRFIALIIANAPLQLADKQYRSGYATLPTPLPPFTKTTKLTLFTTTLTNRTLTSSLPKKSKKMENFLF